MVVATTFGSNVARLKTLAEAGRAADRTICVLGRSMKRMLSAAEEAAVLSGFPKTVTPEEALEVPRRNLMLLVTGSQGERRAASAQLSPRQVSGAGDEGGRHVPLLVQDHPRQRTRCAAGLECVFRNGRAGDRRPWAACTTSRATPTARIWNMCIACPARHADPDAWRTPASGGTCPHRDRSGIAAAVAPNGTMLDLTGDVPEVAEYVETGRLYLDGTALIGALDGVVRDRIRMALNGW
jgi:ribonuclease J